MSVLPGTMPLAPRLAAERFGPGLVVLGTGCPSGAREQAAGVVLAAGQGLPVTAASAGESTLALPAGDG